MTRIVANLKRGRRHDTARKLEQLVALRLVGGEAISDLRRLQEPALSALFDWEGVAHGGTFSRRLKDFTWRHNLGLQQVVRDLYQRLGPSGPRLWPSTPPWSRSLGRPKGLIAYNLLNALRRLALPRAYRAARLKRVSFLFLTLGANVVRHARGLWIKIGRDYPLRLIFYRAWAALTPS